DNPNFLAGLEKRRQRHVVAVRCDFAVSTSRRGGVTQRAEELIGAQPARAWHSGTWRGGGEGGGRGEGVAPPVWRGGAGGATKSGLADRRRFLRWQAAVLLEQLRGGCAVGAAGGIRPSAALGGAVS